jgi:hypothetical protein
MTGHAKLSPSGAHRWMACSGSVQLEAEYPDSSSSYAREGTAAHELAAIVLEHPEAHAKDYIGKKIRYDDHGEEVLWDVTQEMADYVDDYVSFVRQRAVGKTLYIECKLPISHLTGEAGATGTSDVVIIDISNKTIEVIDLKYGMGVRVDAEDNPQLQMYALGAVEEYSLVCDFERVGMVIHMPRLNHVSEWEIPVTQLLQFGSDVGHAAEKTRREEPAFNPGEKQCRFCKAKATCPALLADMSEIVSGSVASADDFAQFLPQTVDSQSGDNYLPMAMAKVGMVEDWCKAVRAEVERRLLAGKQVDGYKLVEGRRGNRAWRDDAEVERLFKSFRLKQEEMYDFKLISPTKADKVLQANPKRLAKAEALVTRSEGKLSVAPVTDKRPEVVVTPISEDFRGLFQTEEMETE